MNVKNVGFVLKTLLAELSFDKNLYYKTAIEKKKKYSTEKKNQKNDV